MANMLVCLAEPDQAPPDKTTTTVNLMYYIYLLKSARNGDIYIGYTTKLKNRFFLHNSGKVKSTKAHLPWILIYYEAYKAKLDATKRERRLKMHAVKKELIQKLEQSLL